MKEIKTIDAVGHLLCHDLTEIVKDEIKHVRFKKGHVIKEEDIPVLLDMGKEHLYIWENREGMLHEDQGAEALAALCLNQHMTQTEAREGKIDILATIDGLLRVDTERLLEVNLSDQLIIATRFSFDPIKKGETIAGTRVIPLVIEKEKLEKISAKIGTKPILELLPYKPLKAGIITTGSEVLTGRIKDTFTPVIKEKLEKYGVEVVKNVVVGDSKAGIVQAIDEMREQGIEFILCSGGMSVDPDDRTPGAIKESGAEIVTYGAPALPGAMFLLGYFQGEKPIVGLPGCVMYNSTTIFDLILPRLVAGVRVTKRDIAVIGHGGLCHKCEVCNWPICGYGKGR